jgi:hypothetical protein
MATFTAITTQPQCPELTEQFTTTILELVKAQSDLFWAKRRIQQLETEVSDLTQDLLRATEKEREVSKGPSLNLKIQQCQQDEEEEAAEQECIWEEWKRKHKTEVGIEWDERINEGREEGEGGVQ